MEENQEVDDPPDQDSGDSTVEDDDVDVAMDDDVLGESQGNYSCEPFSIR